MWVKVMFFKPLPYAETVIYEAFVVMGDLRWGYSALQCLPGGKGSLKKLEEMNLSTLFISSTQAMQRNFTILNPHHNNCFINLQFLQKLSC